MPNEFKIKNGFFSEGDSNITGSLNVSAGITGSLLGTASYATSALTASYALNAGSTSAVAGTTNYVSKFTSGTTIGNSQIFDNGTNVGIGNASPSTKLDINGSTSQNSGLTNASSRPAVSSGTLTNGELRGYSATSTAADDGFLRVSAGGGTNASVKSYIDLSGFSTVGDMDKNIVFGTAGAEKMRINSLGDVGIGTTNPLGPLEVYKGNSGGLGGYIVINNNGLAIANSTALMFGDGGGGSIRAAISTTTENAPYYGQMEFKTGAGTYASLTTKMAITGIGNVGIGTTSPQFKLNLYSSTGSPNIIGTNDVFNNSPMVIGHGYDGTAYGPGYESLSNITAKIDFISDVFIGYVGDAIRFSTTPQQIIPINSDTSTERMRISSGGNVGIGTTSPSNLLHIAQANYNFVRVEALGSPTNYSTYFGVSGPNSVIYNESGMNMYLDSSVDIILRPNGGNELVRLVGSTDNVGIGTSTPDASAILDVTSTTQGFLPPRMTDTEMNAISSPSPGLIVWNTDSVQLFVFDGASWRKIAYG